MWLTHSARCRDQTTVASITTRRNMLDQPSRGRRNRFSSSGTGPLPDRWAASADRAPAKDAGEVITRPQEVVRHAVLGQRVADRRQLRLALVVIALREAEAVEEDDDGADPPSAQGCQGAHPLAVSRAGHDAEGH